MACKWGLRVTSHLLTGMILQVHSYDHLFLRSSDHAAQLSSYQNRRDFLHIGDYTTYCSYMGIPISHYKDPHKRIRTAWNVLRVLNVAPIEVDRLLTLSS